MARNTCSRRIFSVSLRRSRTSVYEILVRTEVVRCRWSLIGNTVVDLTRHEAPSGWVYVGRWIGTPYSSYQSHLSLISITIDLIQCTCICLDSLCIQALVYLVYGYLDGEGNPQPNHHMGRFTVAVGVC